MALTILGWRFSCGFLKHGGKMGGVAEPDAERNLRNRRFRGGEALFRRVDADALQIMGGCGARVFLEHSVQMRRADMELFGEHLQGQRFLVAALNYADHVRGQVNIRQLEMIRTATLTRAELSGERLFDLREDPDIFPFGVP